MIGGEGSVFKNKWPGYDEKMLLTDTVVVPVQMNGKLRGKIEISRGMDREQVVEAVLGEESIATHLDGKEIKKWVIIPDKLVNMVV